jgi:hypothetical protein
METKLGGNEVLPKVKPQHKRAGVGNEYQEIKECFTQWG